MGPYAIRTRLCSPNTLFGVRIFSDKKLSKFCKSGHCWGNVWFKMWHVFEKRRSKKYVKKSAPPDANSTLSAGQEAPGEGPSRARFLNKKQESEQETTTAAHF